MLLQDLKLTFGADTEIPVSLFKEEIVLFLHLVLRPTKDQNCFLLPSKSWFAFSTILFHILQLIIIIIHQPCSRTQLHTCIICIVSIKKIKHHYCCHFFKLKVTLLVENTKVTLIIFIQDVQYKTKCVILMTKLHSY